MKPSARLLLLCLACAFVGCRKDEPPPPKSKPASPVQPPAGQLPPAAQQAPPASAPTAPAPTAPAPAAPAVRAADPTSDDPATPPWLPKPEEIGGWVRTSNVAVVLPGEWSALGDDGLEQALSSFSVKSASQCRYHAVVPADTQASVQITLVEAHGPADAYGLFTNMIPAAFDRKVGSASSSGVTADGGRVMHCLQGQYYVHAALSAGGGPPPAESLEKLVAGLVKPIPSAEPPVELSYLPTQGRIPGCAWLVRRTLENLPKDLREEILRGGATTTAEALGLNADTIMAIAAFDAGPGERPNYVWVITYPTVEEARNAYNRYQAALQTMQPGPEVIMLSPSDEQNPTGRFLVGSWTREQESFMHVMNEVASRLPG